MDESKLIERACSGDREALAQLLYYNYEIVVRYMLKMTLDLGIAEDAAQEAMAKAVEKFHTYNPNKAKLSTWLIQLARNTYIDRYRKTKKEVSFEEQTCLESENENSFHEKQDILKALGNIKEKLRQPLILRYYYDYSIEEISRQLKIPVGTVKSRLHNGLKKMREVLGDYEY